jgi:hypothetical protein
VRLPIYLPKCSAILIGRVLRMPTMFICRTVNRSIKDVFGSGKFYVYFIRLFAPLKETVSLD